MKTLGDLLYNFRKATVDYRELYGSEEELKSAQEAIVKHVEGAMIDALAYGKSSGCRGSGGHGWKDEGWDKLVGKWTK